MRLPVPSSFGAQTLREVNHCHGLGTKGHPCDAAYTRPKVFRTDDVSEALRRILNGQVVELATVKQVNTVLKKLADIALDAEKKGAKAPVYDLCQVAVAGTNLFCAEALKSKVFPHGIPRIQMPQMKGFAIPGTAADRLPKVKSGKVDATHVFIAHLHTLGIDTKDVVVPAAALKASQSQLVGPKVAAMMEERGTKELQQKRIFISRDNYIVDGHHHWAALVGKDAKDGHLGDVAMHATRVDAPITEILQLGKTWAKRFGIRPSSVTREARLREYNTQHEPAGSPKGGQFAPKQGGAAPGGAPSPAARHAKVEAALKTAEITSTDPTAIHGGVSGGVILVSLSDGTKAVYKPETGESWRITAGWVNPDIPSEILGNPRFSQAEREAAAYEVDQLIGTDIVPESVLREHVNLTGHDTESDDEEARPDTQELQAMYDDWREGQVDRAYDVVGEQMMNAYADHLNEVERQYEDKLADLRGLWDEVVEENPDLVNQNAEKYGADIDQHPALQDVGSTPGEDNVAFDVHKLTDKHLDPVQVLKDLNIEPDDFLSGDKEDAIKGAMVQALKDGYIGVGDVDSNIVKEEHTYNGWIEAHNDTENRLMDSAIQSFTAWKQDRGYRSDVPHRLGVKNPNAPHPDGGSLQRFIEGGTYFGAMDDEQQMRGAILHYAVGAMDGHGKNVLYDPRGEAWLVDNGLSFPATGTATLRSIPAHFYESETTKASQARLTPLREKLLANLRKADLNGFFAQHPSMSDAERESFKWRINNLTKALATPGGLQTLWQGTNNLGRR